MSTDDVLVDKAFIFWHIIAYFFIVIANVVQAFLYFKYPITYEISSYCLLVINLACSTILAAIVNTIFSKYLQPQTSSDDSILKSVLTSSVQESLSEMNSSFDDIEPVVIDLTNNFVPESVPNVDKASIDKAILDTLFKKVD